MNRYIAVSVIAVAALVLSAPSQASAVSPTEALHAHLDRALGTLADPAFRALPSGERADILRQMADQVFDWNATARAALGRYWADRTPMERQQFVTLFTDLLERSYLSRIEMYRGESVTYLGEDVDGDAATVRTTIRSRHGDDLPIVYRMQRQPGDHWKVYDVDVSGVSLISNYRAQFASVIQASSYETLVARIRAKLGEPQALAGSPQAN